MLFLFHKILFTYNGGVFYQFDYLLLLFPLFFLLETFLEFFKIKKMLQAFLLEFIYIE